MLYIENIQSLLGSRDGYNVESTNGVVAEIKKDGVVDMIQKNVNLIALLFPLLQEQVNF